MKIPLASFILYFMFFLLSCSSDTGPDLFAIPYHPDLDVTHQAQLISVGLVDVRVDVNRPIKPFQHQYFVLTFYQDSEPAHIHHPKLTFNMKMDMGRLIYLPSVSDRKYVADVQIPKCLTGDIRWYGKIEFEHQGQAYSKVFLFDAE